jgi:hypothetical protein
VGELPTVSKPTDFQNSLSDFHQTASLATLNGDALITLLAGFAANSMGSFVKGFTPERLAPGFLVIRIIVRRRSFAFHQLYNFTALLQVANFTERSQQSQGLKIFTRIFHATLPAWRDTAKRPSWFG